jgi:hypothetical protein
LRDEANFEYLIINQFAANDSPSDQLDIAQKILLFLPPPSESATGASTLKFKPAAVYHAGDSSFKLFLSCPEARLDKSARRGRDAADCGLA